VIATAAITEDGWIAEWNTTTVPDGIYTLESVAIDPYGESGTSPPITMTVAN
jgi:hypothetical protein